MEEGPTAAGGHGCPICRATVAPGTRRCPACGLHFEGGPGWPDPFVGRTRWAFVGGVAFFYLVTLAVVLVAR